MDNPTPMPSRPMSGGSAGVFSMAMIWSTPWLVLLTIYFILYDWKPTLSLFDGAKPGFITLLGMALFTVTFLAVYTLNHKRPMSGMGGMQK